MVHRTLIASPHLPLLLPLLLFPERTNNRQPAPHLQPTTTTATTTVAVAVTVPAAPHGSPARCIGQGEGADDRELPHHRWVHHRHRRTPLQSQKRVVVVVVVLLLRSFLVRILIIVVVPERVTKEVSKQFGGGYPVVTYITLTCELRDGEYTNDHKTTKKTTYRYNPIFEIDVLLSVITVLVVVVVVV
jgi:hypothetical protein